MSEQSGLVMHRSATCATPSSRSCTLIECSSKLGALRASLARYEAWRLVLWWLPLNEPHYEPRVLCRHAFAADALAELAPTATPRPVLLDVFSQANSWQDHVSTEVRPNIACAGHWQHCTCLSKARAFDGATVLPPCWAAHRVILMAVLRLVGGDARLYCSHNIVETTRAFRP